MSQEQSGQERTEEATPKRREDSKKKGQIPRSKELNTFVSLIGAGLAMLVLGPVLIDGLINLMASSLDFNHTRVYDTAAIPDSLGKATKRVLMLISPIYALMTVVTLMSPIALGGFMFSGSSLAPKFERIDPFKGLARILSPKGLLELVKALAKFMLVALLVLFVFKLMLNDIIRLPMQEVVSALNVTGNLLVNSFLAFSAILIIVVAIDVPYQLWDHSKKLKMTKQEIKDEMKETDGKPEVKQAIRQRQQEMSQRRMMEDVPTADVVITNPTHYSVAIRYDQEGSGAPVVVAKGKDHMAFKIREIAREHGIVIFPAPPLARALFASTELNEEIPENLFAGVAQVLAYIFQLQQAVQGARITPQAPEHITVPEEYTRKELI